MLLPTETKSEVLVLLHAPALCRVADLVPELTLCAEDVLRRRWNTIMRTFACETFDGAPSPDQSPSWIDVLTQAEGAIVGSVARWWFEPGGTPCPTNMNIVTPIGRFETVVDHFLAQRCVPHTFMWATTC